MNWLDIVLIVILGFSLFLGLKTGLIKAALSLAGLIIGVILAGQYYIPLSARLTFIPAENIAKIVAFIIIVMGILIAASIAASLLTRIVSAVMLGWANRLGGAVFGLVLGGILCGALLAAAIQFLDIPGMVAESAVARLLLDYLPAVLALLPDEFDAVHSFFQ